MMREINERTGSDGKTYAIQFEIRLPAEWNGRFLHQVNGGNDGVVVPAMRSISTASLPSRMDRFTDSPSSRASCSMATRS